ncbi:MAG: hypothetical protein GEEBNDBF_01640 [bacterium]|nr:hypothetical protein [bacterium]
MRRQICIPLALVLPLILGCTDAPQLSEKLGTRNPEAASLPGAATTETLDPAAMYTNVAAGKPGAREFMHLLMLSGELGKATYQYARLQHQLPDSVTNLTDLGLLFHLPLQQDGTPYQLISDPAIEVPEAGAINIVFGSESLELRMRHPQDASRVLPVRVPLTDTLQQAAADPGIPEAEILATQRSLAAAHAPLSAVNEEIAGHQLLWDSLGLPEIRQRLLAASLHDRLTAHVMGWGTMPASWEDLLNTLQIAPIGYLPADVTSAPVAGRSITVGTDGALLVQAQVWTRLPGTDTRYVRFPTTGDPRDIGRLTPAEFHRSHPNVEFQPLLHAQLPE